MNRNNVDEEGFYGSYGGAYIPEILYKTVQDLRHEGARYMIYIEYSEKERKRYYEQDRQVIQGKGGRAPLPIFLRRASYPGQHGGHNPDDRTQWHRFH